MDAWQKGELNTTSNSLHMKCSRLQKGKEHLHVGRSHYTATQRHFCIQSSDDSNSEEDHKSFFLSIFIFLNSFKVRANKGS